MYKTAIHNRGFTLIEILVVIAISMILMGLVLYPVAQSFKMTRSAQSMVEAQDAARFAMEQISRDIGEAMEILDYTGSSIDVPVLQSDSSVAYISVPDAKIDFVLPKMLVHCNDQAQSATYPEGHPSDSPRDFERGDEALPACPACGSIDVEVRPKLPLEQDNKVVRYFLGLRYNNPKPTQDEPDFGWLSPWGENVAVDEGNQVLLYRVEFDPYDTELLSNEDGLNSDVSDNLCDPKFFYRADTWEAWRRKARVVGVAKYQDLVDGVDADGDGDWEALVPSVTFKYKMLDNDTFTGAYSTDKSFEYPNAIPAVYRAQFGYWLPGYGVAVYRYTYDTEGAVSTVTSYVLSGNGSSSLVVDKWVYDNGTWTGPDTTFDILDYLNNSYIDSETEMAYTIDPVRGQVNFSLIPLPGPESGSSSVSDLYPSVINSNYKTAYDNDRGSARRHATLSTFDPTSDNYLAYATIVPGSERVIGPNMTPGAGNGDPVAYERVPFSLGEPGLNQYRINYDTGDIFFSPVYDQNLPEFDSKGNATLIRVDYNVHFNREDDVVRGEYQTRAAVVVHLGMRMYDPESSKPSSVDLTNTIKVRNALR